MLYYYYFI